MPSPVLQVLFTCDKQDALGDDQDTFLERVMVEVALFAWVHTAFAASADILALFALLCLYSMSIDTILYLVDLLRQWCLLSQWRNE